MRIESKAARGVSELLAWTYSNTLDVSGPW